MITFHRVSYAYPGGAPVLRDVDLTIPAGAFVLVTGISGAGKSTLLRALNGLVPHFYGGTIAGSVTVDGHSALTTPTRLLAQHVGMVFQDPETQTVMDTVAHEILFGMENAGVPPPYMQTRLDDLLRQLHIDHLRTRKLATLSGGEAQRVAIAAALALRSTVLVLDEPTSQLDPLAARDLLDLLARLNCEQGMTIILAEHRLERVLHYATHMLHVDPGHIRFGPAREVLPHIGLRPPVVEAALHFGWQPLPLTVEQARPFVPTLPRAAAPLPSHRNVPHDPALVVNGLTVGYNGAPVLHDLTWAVSPGAITGLLGSNGTGKTTLLKALVGLLKPSGGAIRMAGRDVTRLSIAERAVQVGYVPQNPNSILFAETVQAEIDFTRRNLGRNAAGSTLLDELGLAAQRQRYPRDLSGGERQRVAFSAMLAAEPPIILLDEPTRGLDYVQKQHLVAILRRWSARGKTIVIATHDIEWIAGLATRITVLDHGRIIADGETAEVLLTTPGYTTQLGELFGDPRLMTVEQLRLVDRMQLEALTHGA